LAAGAEQIRAEGKEELFQLASVLEALAQERDKVLGDVHAPAAGAVTEGEDPGRMFVPAGASGTVFADTGFFDESQGALERGPEGRQLGEKALLQLRKSIGFDFHDVCI
jgi:hypothetical protein